MKNIHIVLVLGGILLMVSPGMSQISGGPGISSGIVLGYAGGPGFQFNSTFSNLAQGFPFKMRLGFGYASVEPGKAAEARRIFINDATNGIPEKKGWVWDFRLDFMFQFKPISHGAFLYAGPRYARFTGNFKYVGGNEDFDITSKQWGIGFGFEQLFSMNPHVDLVLNIGADHFFPSMLYGHDTAYSPDGQDVNPRDEYDFNDADDAVAQPKDEFRVMFGINYHLGG